MPAKRFTTVLYKIGQLRCIDVPHEISDALGRARTIPVLATIGGLITPTSLVARKGGGHRLYVPAHFCEVLEIEAGDSVWAELSPDPGAGEPKLPDDLLAVLGKTPGAMEALLARSPADRRQLVRWIEDTKNEDVRCARITKAVELVLEGRPKRKR